jgi:signal peptidase I
MAPTINEGEIFLVNRKVAQKVPRGAIVMIAQSTGWPLIKRVVGLPHEQVSFRLGEVFVNGKMLYEPYLRREQTTFCWKCDIITARDDQYVVLGDNRLVSLDSREYGAVSRSQIIGLIDLPCLPAQFLDRPRYRVLAGVGNLDGADRKID